MQCSEPDINIQKCNYQHRVSMTRYLLIDWYRNEQNNKTLREEKRKQKTHRSERNQIRTEIFCGKNHLNTKR